MSYRRAETYRCNHGETKTRSTELIYDQGLLSIWFKQNDDGGSVRHRGNTDYILLTSERGKHGTLSQIISKLRLHCVNPQYEELWQEP